jgi:DNA polymerase elongation subunit (family B)
MSNCGRVLQCAVCETAAARGIVCRPLELDTDGIWCCLPSSFPEEFAFTAGTSGKQHRINYPGLILNVICAEHNTNQQYHTLVSHPDGSKSYEVSSKMSIEFEVDGPYLVRLSRAEPTATVTQAALPCCYTVTPFHPGCSSHRCTVKNPLYQRY